MIEEAQSHVTSAVTENDITLIKQAKRKGVDEMTSIKECTSADRYLKLLESPTPNPRNITHVQKHLEDIAKELRR